ncbi:steroid 17-alpha-hydroxylase/17,20 lyase [Alosa alosa]|uniref:steroid 17-alpha-hydroxylase/17,20 lyase n=1 Tax=Alosa alosa TaxID=278164 RepID=UPI00201517D6|nr:steroid 17-alpha-hydroxylase/17,20 lyase [Alosa alosa]
MGLTLFLGGLIVLAALLKCLLELRRSPGRLPCLPRLPLLGSLLSLRSELPPHLLFTQLACTYGKLYALYLGPHLALVVNDYAHAREVLLGKGREFAGRPYMVTTELLTRGGKDIAFADYSPLWRGQRKLVHSAFSLFGEGSSKLQTIVLEAADCLVAELLSLGAQRECVGNGVCEGVCRCVCVDPAPAILRAVTNVVCRLVFSGNYSAGDPELREVMDYNDGIVQTIARGALVDIYPWLRIFPNKDLEKLKACVKVRDSLLTTKLEEHKESLTPGDPRDLLDALLEGRSSDGENGLSDDHVLMTAAEAFGAGVETTSTTILWAVAFLLHHPEVQERVQAELDECVGAERAPLLSDRTQMPVLDSVMCEVMRIRPVSPLLIPHVAMQDTSIGGHSVAKGTRVLVNMWAIHHDPQQWDQPESFRPERFLDNSGQRVNPPSFLPFGAGPRVCVGESLARMELFLFLSRVLQRCRFTAPHGGSLPDLQGRYGVVLQPPKYTLTIKART